MKHALGDRCTLEAESGAGAIATLHRAHGVSRGRSVPIAVRALRALWPLLLATALPAQSLPRPADSFTPHLPPGLTLYTDTRFEGIKPWVPPDYNAQVNRGFFKPTGLTYFPESGAVAVTDAVTPWGTTGVDFRYGGNNAGNGVGPTGFSSAWHPWKEYYFALSMFVPANYVVHSNNGSEKLFYQRYSPANALITDNAGSSPIGIGYPAATGPTGPYFTLHMGLQSGQRGTFTQNNAAYGIKGQYNTIEVWQRMNTPGKSDGAFKWWMNGTLVASETGINFVDATSNASYATSQAVMQRIHFDGTRGGGVSTVLTPPGGQYRRFARLAFYGRE